MMSFKDHYKTLGVTHDATPETIKQTYRRLARRYHPDVSTEPDAETKFKEINEAYALLSSPDKRYHYDKLKPSDTPPPQGAPETPHRPTKHKRVDPAFFEEISRQEDPPSMEAGLGDFFGNLFGRKNRAAPSKSTPATATLEPDTLVELDVEDIFCDSVKIIQLSPEHKLQVRIPRGATNGKRIRLPGKGLNGEDLYLMLHIKPHPLYRLYEKDIHMELPVAPWEAALGANITIPTPTGDIHLKIPANSQTGKKIRLTGRGLPHNDGHGDLYVVLHIHVPPATSTQQQALYARMAQLFDWTPRPSTLWQK